MTYDPMTEPHWHANRERVARSLERMVRRFRENRDREYLKYIDALKQKECLGWEAKIKAGVFGGMELNAHCKANEHLGRHLAWNMSIEELLRDVCHECGGDGGVDSGGVTPWGSAITPPCPSCSPNADVSDRRDNPKR